MVFQRRKKHRPTNVGWDACQAPAQINLLWHSTRAGHWTLWFHTTQWHIIYIIDKIDTPLEPDKWFHSCGLTLTRIPKVATVPPGKKTECMILMCNIYIYTYARLCRFDIHTCVHAMDLWRQINRGNLDRLPPDTGDPCRFSQEPCVGGVDSEP